VIHLGGRSAGKLLDLGCGPGRYAIPFARENFSVTGLDRTRLLLDRGKEYADAQGMHVEWVEDDMRRFDRTHTTWSSACSPLLGYFENMNENRAVLENVRRGLLRAASS